MSTMTLRSPTTDAQPVEATSSGVSWAAVVAGAFVAAALSFSLMALGAGMGLSSVSPWPSSGSTVSRIAPAAVVWIILVQALSCALGGYLAGRLRTKWVAIHTHEVYFRDTAHGFLVWAVGLVISAIFLSSMATSIAKEGLSNPASGPHDYYVDSLFRSAQPSAGGGDAEARREATDDPGGRSGPPRHRLGRPRSSRRTRRREDRPGSVSGGGARDRRRQP